jgi:hypothetical protein
MLERANLMMIIEKIEFLNRLVLNPISEILFQCSYHAGNIFYMHLNFKDALNVYCLMGSVCYHSECSGGFRERVMERLPLPSRKFF